MSILIRSVLFVLAAVLTTSAQAKKYESLESPVLSKIRETWTATATTAAAGNHSVLQMRAVDEARAAGGDGAALAEAESKLVAMRDVGLRDGPEAAALLATTLADVGAAVAPLIGVEPGDGPAAMRHVEHLVRAVVADPKNAKAIAAFQKRAAQALAKKDWPLLRAFVSRSGAVDPEGTKAGKYRAAEQALMQNGGLVVRSIDHLMQSYVVLPEGWSSKKTWPMFVAVVGANCAYETMLADLMKAGKKKPYILVVLKTIGNANELNLDKLPYPKEIMQRYAELARRPQRLAWDEQGIMANLAEVRRRFNGEEQFFMTGYSGGGFVLYLWLLHHSEQLLGATAGSANYAGDLLERGKTDPKEGGCPILIVTGSNDSAGKERIFPQAEEAAKKLGDFGFKNIDKRHLTGRSHEPFYELGLELLDKITTTRARRK